MGTFLLCCLEETKAHNDKPFYAAAVRVVAVLGSETLTHEYMQSYIYYRLSFRIIITSQYIAIGCNCRLPLLC